MSPHPTIVTGLEHPDFAAQSSGSAARGAVDRADEGASQFYCRADGTSEAALCGGIPGGSMSGGIGRPWVPRLHAVTVRTSRSETGDYRPGPIRIGLTDSANTGDPWS